MRAVARPTSADASTAQSCVPPPISVTSPARAILLRAPARTPPRSTAPLVPTAMRARRSTPVSLVSAWATTRSRVRQQISAMSQAVVIQQRGCARILLHPMARCARTATPAPDSIRARRVHALAAARLSARPRTRVTSLGHVIPPTEPARPRQHRMERPVATATHAHVPIVAAQERAWEAIQLSAPRPTNATLLAPVIPPPGLAPVQQPRTEPLAVTGTDAQATRVTAVSAWARVHRTATTAMSAPLTAATRRPGAVDTTRLRVAEVPRSVSASLMLRDSQSPARRSPLEAPPSSPTRLATYSLRTFHQGAPWLRYRPRGLRPRRLLPAWSQT